MSTFAGPAYIANLDSEQRKYAKRDEVILREIREQPLVGLMRKRAQKRQVGDYKPYTFEDTDIANSGTLTGNSSGSAGTLSATATEVLISNASTIFAPNDIIHVEAYQTNNSNTSKLFTGEDMIVVSASGDVLTVARNNGDVSVSTYNVTTAVAANTLKWTRSAAAQPEGADVGVSRGHSVASHYNVLQYFEKVWDLTAQLNATDHWGPKERDRRKMQMFRALLREQESSFLYGQRREATQSGKPKPITGGVRWRLATADSDAGTTVWAAANDLVTGSSPTSRIWYVQNQFSKENWGKFIAQSFEYGNSRKIGLHGKYFLNKLEALYGDQVRGYFTTENHDFGLTITTFSSNGKTLDFIHDPVLDHQNPYDLMVIDMEYLKYVYMKDIWHQNIASNGANWVKGQYQCWAGLQMSNVLAHSLLTGMAA